MLDQHASGSSERRNIGDTVHPCSDAARSANRELCYPLCHAMHSELRLHSGLSCATSKILPVNALQEIGFRGHLQSTLLAHNMYGMGRIYETAAAKAMGCETVKEAKTGNRKLWKLCQEEVRDLTAQSSQTMLL